MKFPERVIVCEVSPRDGFQTAPDVVSVENKLKLLDMIVDAGIKYIEVGTLKKDDPKAWKMHNTADVFKALKRREGVEYRALLQDPNGAREAVDCGCPRIKINISASVKHYRDMTGKTIEEGLKEFDEIGTIAANNGIPITGSISLPFISPYDGVISIDFLKQIIKRYISIGADEISLSDAAGMANPRITYERTMDLRAAFPEIKHWILHTHNTRGMALANVVAGLSAGISKLDGALAGIGGCPFFKKASGNISTEDLLFMLDSMGIETGVDFEKAMAAGRFVEELVNGSGIDSYQQRLDKIKREQGGIEAPEAVSPR